jgi:hypothetical protein
MTDRTKLIPILVAGLTTAAFAGCGGLPNDDSNGELQQTTAALGVTGFPQGLVCGLSYATSNQFGIVIPVADESCNGFRTLSNSAAPGFHIATDGDTGLSGLNPPGFKHQAKTSSDPGITATNSDQLFLPRGAACGFKHTCRDNGETCLGFDARVGCPAGFSPRAANDANASSGCNYVWCEYQDPHQLCTSASCFFNSEPQGLACGITDNDKNNGNCLGDQVAASRCSTLSGNPYFFKGFYDAGRGSGHGVGFCTRSVPNPG